MQCAPGEEDDPTIGRVEDKLTLMVTELLRDLTLAEIETNRLKAEKEILLGSIHDLEAQLVNSEQSQCHMDSESAEEDRGSSDGEGTGLSELKSGNGQSDGSVN